MSNVQDEVHCTHGRDLQSGCVVQMDDSQIAVAIVQFLLN